MPVKSITAYEYARQFLYIAKTHLKAGRVHSYNIALNIAAGHMVDAVLGNSPAALSPYFSGE